MAAEVPPQQRAGHPSAPIPILLVGVLLLVGCDLLQAGSREQVDREADSAAGADAAQGALDEDAGQTPKPTERMRAAADRPTAPAHTEGEPSEPADDPVTRSPAPSEPPAEPTPAPDDPLWDGQPALPIGVASGCVQYEDGSEDCDLLQRLRADALAGHELSAQDHWLLDLVATEERHQGTEAEPELSTDQVPREEPEVLHGQASAPSDESETGQGGEVGAQLQSHL